ncbi:restriction endonuclease subunit S [Vibrio cholerae]|uniref:restriction endonuclease subunit S n=1 Tax=Vibrio cholerae TaxID=666 RepID=UPI000DE1BEC5|nr:restriction endonuclease subunit S [Vibrio cholerae]ELH5149830.1 restriction endonuclease subunit S [Vibrio cholerae]RBO18344.1 restriction endonuclease subunit S [Vibrio cholerae]
MSAEKLITDHIDIWTSAVQAKSSSGRGSSKKRELYGIKKLRELILELAVRGKLVPQDPNDEPASVLLERIAAEKAQLVKDKIIRKPKKLDVLTDNELFFAAPSGWSFARLGDLAVKLTDGSHNPARDFGSGYPMFSSQNVHFGTIDFSSPSRYVDEDNFLKEDSRTQIVPGDILLTIVGTIGRAAVVPIDAPKFVLQRSVAVIKTSLIPEFLVYYLASPSCTSYFEANGKGTAQKGIYLGKLAEMPIVVPSLEEQRRIVTKVDELMALCDQLEQQTEASLDAHQVLVETLLATLTNSQDATELMSNWARISEHFETLFTTEQSIDALKQTILQLAVMGKLVPQDPNDEPAAKLLERISEEKAQLVKEKKIKKQKALPPIADEEKPFELPNGWAIERLGNLTQKLGSGSTPRGGQSAYISGGIPFLRSQNVWNDGLKMDDIAFIKQETHDKMENTKVFPDDILLNITGASLGRSTIFPAELVEANVSQHVTIIRLVNSEMNEFVHLGILSPMIQKLVWGRQVGMAIEGLSKKVLEQFEFPVPPLKEQKKIVSKVAQLNVICDQLKQRLRDSQQTQLLLTDAIVGKFVDTSAKKTNMPKDKSSEMMISTILSTTNVSPDNNSPIALMVEQEGGKADAKEIWSKTKYSLPDFYKQLKKEIEAGYIEMPSPASTNN